MVRECAPFVCLFVDLDFAPHWGKWHFVVVKWTIHVHVRGYFGYGIGLMQKVDCYFSLGEKTVPQLHWKIIGDAC